jgi:16S rRNA processing protein RimM
MAVRPGRLDRARRRASEVLDPQGHGKTRVCVGQIGAPHGIHGEVRLRSFTAEPEAIAAYVPLETEDGRRLRMEALRPAKNNFVARFAGIRDREAAAELVNAKLYAARERLPELTDDEFYHADLIGLAAVDRDGNAIGSVVAVHNFGAGDLLEIRPRAGGNTAMVRFDEAHVPAVDVAGGRIIIDPPQDFSKTE